MIKCPVCGKGVENGPLLRINEKGKPGVFAHAQCSKSDQPEDVLELVNYIHKEDTKPTIH